MAIQVNDESDGHPSNCTPAPSQLKDGIRHPGQQSYGQSGAVVSPSVEPGSRVVSQLGQSMSETSEGSADVLNKVISGSLTGRRDDVTAIDIERKISDVGYPLAHGMKPTNAKIPS